MVDKGEGWNDEMGYLSGVAFEMSGGIVDTRVHSSREPEHSLPPVLYHLKPASRAPKLLVPPLEVEGGTRGEDSVLGKDAWWGGRAPPINPSLTPVRRSFSVEPKDPRRVPGPGSLPFRLKERIGAWVGELAQLPRWVAESIEDGYTLPLTSVPPQIRAANGQSVAESSVALEKVMALVAAGAAIELERPAWVQCALHLEVSKGRKPRLCFDGRPLNRYVKAERFKYEDLRVFPQIAEKGDFACQFDIESAYHHVMVHPRHWGLIGFSLVIEGVERYFCFTVLPFGLSTAPFVFTKVTRPILLRWRSMGLRCSLYLDDGYALARSSSEAESAMKRMREDLERFGFRLNLEKSKLVASQELESFLGAAIDLSEGTWSWSEKRRMSLLDLVKEVKVRADKYGTVSRRIIARVVGRIVSAGPLIGPLSRLRTRDCYRMMVPDKGVWQLYLASWWDERVVMPRGVTRELEFWLEYANERRQQPLWKPLWPARLTVLSLQTDASDEGMGAVFRPSSTPDESIPDKYLGAGELTREEALASSALRELRALERGLQSFARELRDCVLVWETDSQAAARIVMVGSMR